MKKTILDEELVPEYTLPYLNAFESLEKWNDAKGEIKRLFMEHLYGRIPEQKSPVSFEIISQTDAINNKAIIKIISIGFKNTPDYSYKMKLYLPKSGKVNGIFLRLNFFDNDIVSDNERIKKWVVVKNKAIERMIDSGFGCAVIVYGDILSGDSDAFKSNYKNIVLASGDNIPINDTGAISIWAWGLMRMCDYFKQNKDFTDTPIFAFGHSRMGKTALWAGANDERISYIISNESGCGGAAISRRCFGETIEKMNTTFPHWLCKKAKEYNDNEASLPIDQHLLLALIAPRALYVASALGDEWSDPKGEFLGAKLANKVYSLYGCNNELNDFPELHSPVGDNLRYHIRAGEHDETEYDWEGYLDLAKKLIKSKIG